jgi:hypothetical protein
VGSKFQSPALSDAKSLGGIIAQDGFDYQLWDGLARLPAWLANPAFEELIFEGLEDLEARFFAPQAPRQRLLERYQAKSGNLAPKDVREVFATFQTFERAYPGLARMHTLVTPRLPPTLHWLARDPARVRKARPFYAPFADVAKASDDQLRKDLEKEFGADLGHFIADSVEISERVMPDRDAGLQAFALALTRTFEHITATPKQIEQAFEALSGLARKSLGVPIKRDVLIGLIEAALGQALLANPIPRIHVRSDRNEVDETAVEIDASAFSGDSAAFPAPSRWQDELVTPLDHTARWLRSRSITRLAVGGSYRLTTAFALGKALRSASGFEFEIETRSGIWSTDDRPRPDDKLSRVRHQRTGISCRWPTGREYRHPARSGRRPCCRRDPAIEYPRRVHGRTRGIGARNTGGRIRGEGCRVGIGRAAQACRDRSVFCRSCRFCRGSWPPVERDATDPAP